MLILEQILGRISGVRNASLSPRVLQAEVTGVTADSRSAARGMLFVAVRGSETDGHAFVDDALEKGCVAAVVSDNASAYGNEKALIAVEDTQLVLGELAALLHGFPDRGMCLIGITGTNGKTTTTWLVEQMLVHSGLRTGVIGTVNYRYHDGLQTHVLESASLTTPDVVTLYRTLATMKHQGVSHVVLEVSSHALDQQRLGGLRFDVACFTNLSRDHLDYHGDMEAYFAAKRLLFTRHLKERSTCVIITDDGRKPLEYGERLAKEIGPAALTCGFFDSARIQAKQLVQTVDGFSCDLDCCGRQTKLTSTLAGAHNVLNVLGAAGVGHGLGLGLAMVSKGLSAVTRVPGRLERIRLPGARPGGPAVFTDYAHTPDALEHVLRSLRGMARGRLLCVFGCGGDRDRGKRPMMGRIAGELADIAVVTSDNPRREEPASIIEDIMAGIRGSGMRIAQGNGASVGHGERACFTVADRREAILFACAEATDQDTVLIAGKGHEDYQITGIGKRFFDDRIEAMNGLLRWNRHHLLAATGGEEAGRGTMPLSDRVSTDTRQIAAGDVFVALKGERHDGHDFIDRAVQQGAGAIVAEHVGSIAEAPAQVVRVADSLRALGELAAYRRRLLGPALTVVAITGSSGKTTVKEMAAAILSLHHAPPHPGAEPVLKTQGNFNNLIGLPLSLLPVHAGNRVAVLEMGMNRPGEIDRLAEIADPDIGCITNVQPAHLEGLGSVAGVARAKGELFLRMKQEGLLAVNLDDPEVRRLAREAGQEQVGYAAGEKGRRLKPRVWATRISSLGKDGSRLTLHIGGWSGRFTLPVPGAHNVSNCLAAAAIAVAAGVPGDEIISGLEQYRPVDRRMAVTSLPGGMQVMNDTYNANPASMRAALETMAGFRVRGKRVAALGEMLELGKATESAHADLGEQVARLGYDLLMVTGPSAHLVAAQAIAGGMPEGSVEVFEETGAMASWLYHMIISGVLGRGDWILVKGSRGMRMETLIEETARMLAMEGTQ